MHPVTRQLVYNAIDNERDYQEQKWGGGPIRSLDEFALYIRDYAEEAAHQLTRGDEEKGLHTIRKVAGLCVAAMEQHGAPPRDT